MGGQFHRIFQNDITSSTEKKLNVIKNLLARIQKEYSKKFLIAEVDNKFKLLFESYSLKEKYAKNTTSRNLKYIKTMCKHARIHGIETSPQLDNIKVSVQKVDNIYLSQEELKLIEEKELKFDYLTNARDWLIISCETGQRVSDFMRFRKAMIRYEENKPLIEFTQVKTGKIMSVPLSKKVLKILETRDGEFPRTLSDQKYNDYIKDVCKDSGLTYRINGSRKNPKTNRKETGDFEKWELVTSHIGRRSFATNNYGRIPTSLLIAATGHSTEKMFLEYIGKTDTQKALQLADFIL